MMKTEPPTGDDLQCMLVTMKQSVLDRAEDRRPAPRRRGRRTGIVLGVIALLGLGATSSGVALGMIPQPFTAEPAPVSTPSPTGPAAPSTPTGAPVEETPHPTPTALSTPTKGGFTLDDPSTWTISGTEMGPVAIGGPRLGETDDLSSAYQNDIGNQVCDAGIGSAWQRTDAPNLVIWSRDEVVIGVRVWTPNDEVLPTMTGPTTSEGIGIGSTLDELRSAYPSASEDTTRSFDIDPLPAPNAHTSWKIDAGTGPAWLRVGADGVHVSSIDIGEFSQASCD